MSEAPASRWKSPGASGGDMLAELGIDPEITPDTLAMKLPEGYEQIDVIAP